MSFLAIIKGSTSFLHFLSTLGLTILMQAGSGMDAFNNLLHQKLVRLEGECEMMRCEKKNARTSFKSLKENHALYIVVIQVPLFGDSPCTPA
jgi:hypothetical protein